MRHLNEGIKKAAVLISLAIIIAGTGIACLILEGQPEAAVDIPYIYNPLPRKAAISLQATLKGEGFIDGEQGAEAVRVMYHPPYNYVFGNTSSRERDFLREDEGGCAFVALVGSLGTVYSVTIFSGQTFVAAKNTGEGFLVLTEADEGRLLQMSYDGTFTNSVSLPSAPHDMYLNKARGEVAVISGTQDLTLSVLSLDISPLRTVPISRANPMTYVGMLAAGTRYYIFANVVEQSPTLISVNGAAVSFDDFNGELSGTTLTDFCPARGGGYLLALIDTQRSNLALVKRYHGELTGVLTGATETSSIKIFDTGSEYYIKCAGQSSFTVALLGEDFQISIGNVTALSQGNLCSMLLVGDKLYAVFSGGQSTTISVFANGQLSYSASYDGSFVALTLEASSPILFVNDGTVKILIADLTFA